MTDSILTPDERAMLERHRNNMLCADPGIVYQMALIESTPIEHALAEIDRLTANQCKCP